MTTCISSRLLTSTTPPEGIDNCIVPAQRSKYKCVLQRKTTLLWSFVYILKLASCLFAHSWTSRVVCKQKDILRFANATKLLLKQFWLMEHGTRPTKRARFYKLEGPIPSTSGITTCETPTSLQIYNNGKQFSAEWQTPKDKKTQCHSLNMPWFWGKEEMPKACTSAALRSLDEIHILI